jgi:hypothetical protein
MNSGPHVDEGEHRIEAALGRLPHWDPPADFSKQLAAAARRQHETLSAPPTSIRVGLLLERLGNLSLLLVGGGLVAGLLAFGIPWRMLAAQPLQLTVLCIVALLVTGAALARRTLFRTTADA